MSPQITTVNQVSADLTPQDTVARKLLVDVLTNMAVNYLRRVKTTDAPHTEERRSEHEPTIESDLAISPSRR